MLIPPQNIQNRLRATAEKGAKVRLRSSHLLIDKTLAAEIFDGEPNVNVIYYAGPRTLMVAPASDELFKKLHKAKQHMLKDKNAKGDKSIALHELLIDNEVNNSDRDLEYELQKALKVLNVKL
ncbi:MAG: hypothetical protein AAFP19_18220 [Bacteroidota bacterium]